MPRTQKGSQIETGVFTATMASGVVTDTNITFRRAFPQAGEVMVVHHLGDEAAVFSVTWTASGTGFTFSCTGSGLPDGQVEFEWVAVEKT